VNGKRVSVIISAYESDAFIAECLHSLRNQTFRDFEIVVVNSSTEERTALLIQAGFPEVLFYQSPSRLLPGAAHNKGVEIARGELLAFIDPDCRARPDWLAGLVSACDRGHTIVGGAMDVVTPTWLEIGQHLTKWHWILTGLPPRLCTNLPTSNLCLTRQVFQDCGPFEPDLYCSDGILVWRACRKGHIALFEPNAVVMHYHHETARSFWQIRVQRGCEFARERTAFEKWSHSRIMAHLLVIPLLPLYVLLRALRHCLRSGWLLRYFLTLPIQVLGHVGWTLGETRAYLGILAQSFVSLRSTDRPPPRRP
jgi:GT2 family glycosyltransferase